MEINNTNTIVENKPSRYFVYARKSTESEDRQILSIDAQVKELTEVADKRGLAVVKIFRESKSAKAPGRQVFNQMMLQVAEGRAQGILCWKLDRLARNPIDGAVIIWAIKNNGVQILTPHQSFSQNDDNSILMYLEFGMAQKYIDDLSRNVKRGLRVKVDMGWLPCVAPIGYKNTKQSERGTNTIIRDEERWDLVRKVWDTMLTGYYSAPQVLEMCRGWGLKMRPTNRRPSRQIGKTSIYRILSNPFYFGVFYFKGQKYQGKHEPLITEHEYWRVQELLGRKGIPRPQTIHFPFPYVGIIKCGYCGASITGERRIKKQKNGNVHDYTYYHCTKAKLPRCPEPYIEVKKLEKQIIELAKSINISPRFLKWALDVIEQEEGRIKGQRDQVVKSQKFSITALDKKLDGLISMRAVGENYQYFPTREKGDIRDSMWR